MTHEHEYEQDERTVAQAVEQRAARLKEVLSWAARRLDDAATMAVQAIKPWRPGTGEYGLLDAAKILSAAENIPGEVITILGELEGPDDLMFEQIQKAFDVSVSTVGQESEKWQLEEVGRWTVRELRERLEARTAVPA